MSSNAQLDRLQTSITVPSHANAGVDGNAAHNGHGYHEKRNELEPGDYSSGKNGVNVSLRDLGGSASVAAAVDIGLGAPQMVVVTQRLINAIPHGLSDVVREFNGTLDNRNTLNRDAVLGWKQNYTPDSSHLYHVHIGFFRDTCENEAAINRVIAVINGTDASAPPVVAPPTPAQPRPYQGADWPNQFPRNQYYGLISGPAASHGGYYPAERTPVLMIQRRLIAFGFVPGIARTDWGNSWADGKFEQPTADAVARFQHAFMPNTQYYGQVWSDDWAKLFNL